MLTRILTAVVALAVLIPILLFAPYWAVAAVFGLLAAVAVFEISGCVGLRRERWLTVTTMVLCAVYIVVPNVCGDWNITTMYSSDISKETFDLVSDLRAAVPAVCRVLLVLVYLVAAVLRHSKLPADRLMLQFGMSIYVTLGFDALTCLAGITTLDATHRVVHNNLWLWVALCIPWVADTLAYFTGYLFGKRKLCPEISPKKTIAGAVGGVVGTGVAAFVVFGFAEGWATLPGISPVVLAGVPLAAMLLAIVSIFGDLFASVLKRQFGVKDYGSLFPGHGGIMDRFDSTIPVAIVLLLLVELPSFGALL